MLVTKSRLLYPVIGYPQALLLVMHSGSSKTLSRGGEEGVCGRLRGTVVLHLPHTETTLVVPATTCYHMLRHATTCYDML